MKKLWITLQLLAAVLMLAACGAASSTVIEMELSRSYDDFDPYVNEALFYVAEGAGKVVFDAAFSMEGENGTLEIADNETKVGIWSRAWQGDADEKFTVELDGLAQDREYVVRLTGYGVERASVRLTSDDDGVMGQARPRKPNRVVSEKTV